VHDLIGELNAVLGAVYEAHQRHGLAIEQLFEPNVRFFVARLDGLVVGCGGVAMLDDYPEGQADVYPTSGAGSGNSESCSVQNRG
jgi:putative acetyltransferase